MSQLLAAEGLFPGPFELIELVVDGETLGVYYLTEDPAEWMRSQFPGLSSVIRRNSEAVGPMTRPEVEWSAGQTDQAIQSYDQLLSSTAGLTGAPLEKAIRGRLDMDAYMRWVAVMTTFMSGDYVDEIFLYGTPTTNGAQSGEFFGVFNWDPDDVLTPCHNMGRFAIEDPQGLLYCTEAELDRGLFPDNGLYLQYAAILSDVLVRMTPERFKAALDKTTARLLEFFKDDRTRAAMVELRTLRPAAMTNFAAMQALLEEESAAMLDQFVRHRAALLPKVESVRGGQVLLPRL